MKVLVATTKRQGMRKNDFCHATEGELVKFSFECDGEKVDGKCGCKRSMGGINSRELPTDKSVGFLLPRNVLLTQF